MLTGRLKSITKYIADFMRDHNSFAMIIPRTAKNFTFKCSKVSTILSLVGILMGRFDQI